MILRDELEVARSSSIKEALIKSTENGCTFNCLLEEKRASFIDVFKREPRTGRYCPPLDVVELYVNSFVLEQFPGSYTCWDDGTWENTKKFDNSDYIGRSIDALQELVRYGLCGKITSKIYTEHIE